MSHGGQGLGRVSAAGVVLLLVGCSRPNPGYGLEDGGGSAGSGTTTSGDPATTNGATEGEGSGEGSGGEPGEPCGDGPRCHPQASCTTVLDQLQCICNEGLLGDGTDCASGGLGSLRIELPCMQQLSIDFCGMEPADPVEAVLAAEPGVTYELELWVRGVVEHNRYGGIESDSWFEEGPLEGEGGYNTFTLEVLEPAQTHHLNAGPLGAFACFERNHVLTVQATAGTVLRLSADPGDIRGLRNKDEDGVPIVIPGVEPAPEPFDGQFLQVDVVSASPVP